jgi:hypothetical protein
VAFANMVQEILGIPGMNRGLAATRINEAFTKIQNENVWSFQCVTNGWLTPNMLGGQNSSFLSPGTITVVPFTTTITADAVATAAWTANVPYPPLLTQQQIRIPLYSLYSIIALGNNGTVAYATVVTPGSGQTPGVYTIPVLDPAVGAGATLSITVNADGTVTLPPVLLSAGTGYTTPYITFAEGGTSATFSITLIATITIDRPWTEPPQVNSNYAIYQAYYAAPPGFKRWFNIRDTTNNEQMDWWSMTQIDLSQEDPQRERYDQPEFVVPFGIDNRPGSATLGQQLYELWPHPISQLPYTFMCQCNWPALAIPTDTVPYPLTEGLLKHRTYETVALWKESQKGDEMERGSGANWQFLVKAHHEEYKDDLRQIRIMDRHLMELYFTKARMTAPFNGGEPFTNTNGTANVGSW